MPRDPAAVVPGPAAAAHAAGHVQAQSELDQLLDPPAGGEPRALRDRALLELLYGCGLRASEACALRLRDVDLGRAQVRVIGKGDKQRVVPLGGAAEQALDRYLRPWPARARPRPWPIALFLSVRGRPLQPLRRAPQRWQRALTPRGAALRAHRTRCGTHLPLISWRAAPIY